MASMGERRSWWSYLSSLSSRSTASGETRCWLSLFKNLDHGLRVCRPRMPSKCGSSSRLYLSR